MLFRREVAADMDEEASLKALLVHFGHASGTTLRFLSLEQCPAFDTALIPALFTSLTSLILDQVRQLACSYTVSHIYKPWHREGGPPVLDCLSAVSYCIRAHQEQQCSGRPEYVTEVTGEDVGVQVHDQCMIQYLSHETLNQPDRKPQHLCSCHSSDAVEGYCVHCACLQLYMTGTELDGSDYAGWNGRFLTPETCQVGWVGTASSFPEHRSIGAESTQVL
jgi:hypothetical protein